jgi:hypothetical protein
MNVQQLNPLLPWTSRPLSPLLGSAFQFEAAVPQDMECKLTALDYRCSAASQSGLAATVRPKAA